MKPIILNINVTEEDIALGRPKHSGHCMIAEALKRAFKQKFKYRARSIHVDAMTMRLTDGVKDLRYIWLTPSKARLNLMKFEYPELRKTVKPFHFKIGGAGCQVIPQRRNEKKRRRRPEKLVLDKSKHKHKRDLYVPMITGGTEPPIFSNSRRVFGNRLPKKDLLELSRCAKKEMAELAK